MTDEEFEDLGVAVRAALFAALKETHNKSWNKAWDAAYVSLCAADRAGQQKILDEIKQEKPR